MTEESKQPEPPEPGAPIPDDAIDPELIALRRGAGDVSPLLSFSVLVFCAYMMITLRADLRFSREAAEPRRVEDLVALTANGDLHDRFVHVRAVPDRSFSAQVSAGGAIAGQRVTPVLGSGDRVWLYADSNPWTALVAHHEFQQGRLRPLDDLPFADGLRAFVRQQPPTPRAIDLESLRAAVQSGAAAVTDPAGGPLAIAADTPVTVHEIIRGRAELVARATADRLDEAAWNLVLTNAGVLPPGERAYQGSVRAFWYRVPAAEGLAALRTKLRADNLFAVDVRPVVETRRTTWGQLAATSGGVRFGERSIAWTDIDRASVSIGHTIPAEAVILLTHEQPATYWYLLPIYVAMALLALLFAWALFRAVRRMIPATA